MDKKAVRSYLLSRPEACEDYPFGPEVAVYKIKNKMFATLCKWNTVVKEQQGDSNDQNFYAMNLKCDPDEAIALRDIFTAVLPGYHMNKKHWNTLIINGSIPAGEIERMIDRSYGLVVKGLKKIERDNLLLVYGAEVIYA